MNISKAINILLFTFIAWTIYQRVPIIIDMYQRQGQKTESAEVRLLQGDSVQVPLPKRHLLVFWATWCGPCKVELARVNNLIKKGAIKDSDVLAISIGETPDIVAAFSKENDYRFSIATDPQGKTANLYKVAGTPTLFLIDEKGQVEWTTMGMSPTLELRLKSFLNP